MMDMKSNSKPKNLLQEEKENTPQEGTPSIPETLESFLDQMGVEWEKRGKAIYIYPSTLQGVKELIEKMPSPQETEYVIIPLGNADNYNVFVMVTTRSVSIRIGYGRNSIPFSTSLNRIVEKLAKVEKELGVSTRRNGKNLLE